MTAVLYRGSSINPEYCGDIVSIDHDTNIMTVYSHYKSVYKKPEEVQLTESNSDIFKRPSTSRLVTFYVYTTRTNGTTVVRFEKISVAYDVSSLFGQYVFHHLVLNRLKPYKNSWE